MARITCFDGVGCIGGNKILLEDGGRRLFFDFGRNFGAEGRFYEEFLQPKNCAGLFEHVRMGLLPPLASLYRQDLCWGRCDPWGCVDCVDVGEIGGVLVSHAHLDHIGAVHFLRTDVPVYSTAMTAAVGHALQDTGTGSLPAEYCYWVPRRSDDESGLSNEKGGDAFGRRYHLVDPPAGEEFTAFWNRSPWKQRPVIMQEFGDAGTCAGMNVRCWPVDHSVYGASAWAVETGAGWVVYAGDLRLHGSYGYLTRRFAEEAAALNPVALILEGTRITSKGGYTESDVRGSCLEAVRGCEALAVADFGPRNVERLLSFREVALATGRKLAILPKDAYLLDAMRSASSAQEVPALDESWARIYWEFSGERSTVWRDAVRQEHEGLMVRPEEVAASQDRFICCFSFWDANELAYLRPAAGSVWVYSSCEAFDEEMAITAGRLDNWLQHFGVRRFGRLTEEDQETDPFHVSGHASGPDLLEIARTVRPKTLIPVHTEHPQVYVDELRGFCNVTLPERGVPMEF